MRRFWLFGIAFTLLLLASCGGGGGGGTILPPNGGGGGGGGASPYPQHYTTDLDGFWSDTSSDFHFTYNDPQGLFTSAKRAEFEAMVLEDLEGEGDPYEIRNGRAVVGTLPTLGYETLELTENRISKLSNSQYEQVFRFVGSASVDGDTVAVQIEGIATGFVNTERTRWSGSESVSFRWSGTAGTVQVTISCDFVATKGSAPGV